MIAPTKIRRSQVLGTLFVLSLLLICTGCFDLPEEHAARPGDAPTLFDSLFAEAEKVYFAGDYEGATALLTDIQLQSDEILKTTPDDPGAMGAKARAMTWIALAAWRLGQYEESRRLHEEALSIKEGHGLRDQLFRSYNGLGLLAWNENRLTAAKGWYEKASAIADDLGMRLESATARGNLALVQTELGEFDEARRGFLLMREEAAALAEARVEGNALTNLGMLEIRIGNPRTAIPYLMEARAKYDSIPYPTGVLSALGQLGTAYAAMGEPRMAFVVLDSALAMARDQGLRQEEASNLEALAELYREAGDYQRTLTLYEAAKEINAELDLTVETGADLRGEAEIQARVDDTFSAHRLIEEALTLHREAGARMDELYDLLSLAEVQAEMGASRAVQSTLVSAESLAEELDARIAQTALGLTRARIAESAGDPQAVLDGTQELVEDPKRGGLANEWEAYLLRSRAFSSLGQPDSAIASGQLALAAVERVRNGFGSAILRTAYVSDRREVYSHLVNLLLARDRVAEAFRVSDAARGRALIENIAMTGGETTPEPAAAFREAETLLWEIDQLVESIDYLESFPREERSGEQDEELARLYGRVADLRSSHEEMTVRLSEAKTSPATLLGGTTTTLDAVQSSLGPDQLLVEFFVGADGGVIVFAVGPSQLRYHQTEISSENLASRIRIARSLVGSPGDGDPRGTEVLSGLYDALVRPVLEGFRAPEGILVVPHGVTAYLPFAALYDSLSGRYVAEDYAVRILPSASALPALAVRAAKARGPLISASALAPFPDELPATLEEVHSVSGRIPRTREFVGTAATEKHLRQALRSSDAVHVATHGVLNRRNALFSRLELAEGTGPAVDDGRLEVHELLTISVGAPVVFLSGCNTAIGASEVGGIGAGEDYATLAQAFLFAGAGNVIATLWPVEDEGAAVFASEFYQALQGRSPSDALATAQRAMLGKDEFRSPYYWAAYQLLGDDFSNLHGIRAQDAEVKSVPQRQRQ